MLTFAEARRAAVNQIAQWYQLEGSAYAAAPEGWEDDTHWHVAVGDFRFIVRGDVRFRSSVFPDVRIDKRTGEVATGMRGTARSA